jgi:hypothetical protein
MKTLALHRITKTLALLFPALFAASSAHALTFCVNDVATLEAALSFSTTFAAEPITIKIVQGTYLASNWDYEFAPQTMIQGGYTAQCASRSVNPINTIINLQGHKMRLAQHGGSSEALLDIEGVTFTNGGNIRLTAGLGSGDGSVKLSKVTLSHLAGGAESAINVVADSNTLSLQNVLIDHLSSSAGCIFYVSSVGGAQVVINHMTADLPIGSDLCMSDSSTQAHFDISN